MQPWSIVRRDQRLEAAGELRFADAAGIWPALRTAMEAPGPELVIDLSRATAIDGAIMALLIELRRELLANGVRCEIGGASERLQAVVHAYGGDVVPPPRARIARAGAITQVGIAVERLLDSLRTFVVFVGDLAETIGRACRHAQLTNLRSLPALIARAGFDGIAIVVVLNLLVGIVMALQTARQLEYFGANIYVADIVGISITRELAPLMTAVILSGRSGAAFAAELGTMRVSEEIDALRTMGFAPISYLVLPRVLALAVAAPLLTLLGDVAGVLGGIGVASASLDVTPTRFVTEMQRVLVSSDVWTGLVKSFVFGIVVALVGCRRGLVTRGAAEGVGRGTTATIVECLFVIVILDTLFTMVFRGVGV